MNIREGYRITTLEVIELIEDLISYVKKKDLLEKIQLEKTKVRQYGAKIKIENLSNTLTLILSKTAQQQSSSVMSNRSTALITDKFGVALLTKPAILNNANVALVDAVHYSQKLEENYFEVRAQYLKYNVIDALTMTLIKDDNNLLGTVNSHIKLRRLRAVMLLSRTLKTEIYTTNIYMQPPLKRRKTEAADSRYAKASRRRTKKDKDSEDSDTSSDVLRLRKEAQLKKTRDEEELAKAKKEKEEKEAQERETYLDIDPEDDSEDEEATTAKDLAREQKERLKALLNAKMRDSLSARVGTAMEHCTLEDCDFTLYQLTDAYILYFKELLSDNGGIFANAIGMGKTRAIVLAVLIGHLYPTEGERTFYCACERSSFFNAEPRQAAIMMTGWGRAADAWKNETILEANTPAVHSKATKYRLALLAARFIIVCGFRKVDKHMFRAYNTMSVTAQRTIIRKGGPYVEKRAILLPGYVTVWRRTVFDEFHNCKSEGIIMAKFYQDIRSYNYRYQWKAWALSGTPMEQGLNEILIFVSLALIALNGLAMAKQWRNMIANVKHDVSEHESSYNNFLPYFQSCLCLDFLSTVQNAEQQCRDILEKEGLDELEASRRVIFNCFKMQAIASYSALATLKAAQFKTYSSCKVKRFTLNSVKDLFTNLSKDYFLVREARAITKSSPKFQNLLNLCSEVEILGTLSRTWSIAAEDAAKAANTLLPPKEVRAKILIGSYKPIVQAVTWLGLREKFSDESVLRDLDGPWIIVASMAFAEAITLIEATHVLAEMCVSIVYFNLDSELELKVLGKQDVKTTSRDKLQGGGSTVTD
ncbi:hypothetical protein HBH69_209590 [Parastagonospora nodorum]|nr:hypothetical protein HBH69_209590 [Parastagonospora nodorum]